MKVTLRNNIILKNIVSLFMAMLLCYAGPTLAKDTDIYSVNAKQNAYVLMDSSGSMNYGVYEHTIDYGAMFDYLFTLKDDPFGDYDDYIYDTVNNSAVYYGAANHKQKNKIYLWKGEIRATIATVDGNPVAFSGDAADPNYLWYTNDLIDTHTLIDVDGNLSDDGTGKRRLTVNASGNILLDGSILPLGLDIKEHDFVTLYNGSIIDNGFNGLMNAPGYYFSGYEGVAVGGLNQIESGDENVYFFVTGNWVNMQAMYNLHYKDNPPGTPAAGDAAWVYETFPLAPTSWPKISYALDYPAGSANYANNLTEINTTKTIVSAGAKKIQIHFSAFGVQGDGNPTTFNKDYLKIYDQTGTLVAQYDNDNKPTAGDGWSPVITGNQAILKLASDASTNGQGYTIDKIRVVYYDGDSYLMQSRMDVAKDAMKYVVDEFRGKMNWGFASFKNGNGAQLGPFLNPTDNDDTQRAAIITQLNNVTALGGTPLMEALQDVWNEGYYGRKNVLNKLLCRKNYVISMTDGFPSEDTDAGRISGVTFDDWDNDNWTQDPYQYTNPTEDYYDDVAHWMYTHSWLDNSVVPDPANSYVNVITHHIAFGAKHPLLQDAAGESGGEYIVAYNKEQLIAAFYSLALMMTESVSFTAPVVSVDAVNKIQSGDDLYMGLFLPQDSTYWAGNVKKFKVGDGTSADRPKRFMIYDQQNNEAIDSSGQFIDNTATFWGDDTDVNDSDFYGEADITEDGAGEVLLEDVTGFFSAGTFWNRPIYTWKNGAMVKFDRNNITAADLAVADDATRDKLINFTHGYTYDANVTTGSPLAVRSWILGPIIHSRPVVVDYFDTADSKLPLIKRLIAVGSNDGMLHVFDDETGREVFAFIPTDILPKLQHVQANDMYETLDGLITLYRQDKNPRYLIFGERRGGNYFWNLDISCKNSSTNTIETCTASNIDPLKWTVAWSYTHSEISQSWSEVKVASLPVDITADGLKTYKDVAIFTGGYDPFEDNFPEPFTDQDSNGTPYKAGDIYKGIDNSEWSQSTPTQDVYNDNNYNTFNPMLDNTFDITKAPAGYSPSGRAIFVVDIENPAAVTNVTLSDSTIKQILPFSITYGATAVNTGVTQTSPEMKFSFPANPSVVTGLDKYIYKSGDSQLTGFKENVLLSIYAVDVYANIFKSRFSFEVENPAPVTSPDWKINNADWVVNKIFSANPGSMSGSGRMGAGVDNADLGRKAFYPPAISWGGSKAFFEAGNYYFPDVAFDTKDKMASLFFGTGDRENPKYTMIRNRFYAIYDDSSVTAEKLVPAPPTNVPVSSAPYVEDDLLNLTCDELGKDSIINACYLGTLGGTCNTADATSADVDMKSYLKSLLTDDAVYNNPSALEYGPAYENDAKGWYIVLADQGKSSVCGHMTYPTTIFDNLSTEHDYHAGEQVLSQATLYFGTLYFTTYQASISDPCNPQGNGFSYALNYLNGSATYDLYDQENKKTDLTDRYKKFTNIFGIPSGFTVITSGGHAAAMASVGGAIAGPGPVPTNPFNIATPGLGLELFYWRDSNSQQP